uniref:Putative secreted protein n=1 Tax=Anopheles darlingi TaxID=43151 RepID=A0A2M4DMX2_ANODA
MCVWMCVCVCACMCICGGSRLTTNLITKSATNTKTTSRPTSHLHQSHGIGDVVHHRIPSPIANVSPSATTAASTGIIALSWSK